MTMLSESVGVTCPCGKALLGSSPPPWASTRVTTRASWSWRALDLVVAVRGQRGDQRTESASKRRPRRESIAVLTQLVERFGATQHTQGLENCRTADLQLVDQLEGCVAAALAEALDDQALAVAAEQEVGEGVARASVGAVVRDGIRRD